MDDEMKEKLTHLTDEEVTEMRDVILADTPAPVVEMLDDFASGIATLAQFITSTCENFAAIAEILDVVTERLNDLDDSVEAVNNRMGQHLEKP
jgi:hypothetical protein